MNLPLQAFRPGAPDFVTLMFMGILVSISVRTFRKAFTDTSAVVRQPASAATEGSTRTH
jgi:hypothetical protein